MGRVAVRPRSAPWRRGTQTPNGTARARRRLLSTPQHASALLSAPQYISAFSQSARLARVLHACCPRVFRVLHANLSKGSPFRSATLTDVTAAVDALRRPTRDRCNTAQRTRAMHCLAVGLHACACVRACVRIVSAQYSIPCTSDQYQSSGGGGGVRRRATLWNSLPSSISTCASARGPPLAERYSCARHAACDVHVACCMLQPQ